MKIMTSITIPEQVYRFYQRASRYVANCAPEDIMADALTAYARLLSEKNAVQDIPNTDSADQPKNSNEANRFP